MRCEGKGVCSTSGGGRRSECLGCQSSHWPWSLIMLLDFATSARVFRRKRRQNACMHTYAHAHVWVYAAGSCDVCFA